MDAEVERLLYDSVALLGPLDRLRRLGFLCEGGRFDDAASGTTSRRLRARLERITDGTFRRADLDALDDVMRGRDRVIAPEFTEFFTRTLGVADGYITDSAVAERAEEELLVRLLSESGVDRPVVCRVQPARPIRAAICVKLVEISRNRQYQLQQN
ncbi:hypothetical protein [Pseudonocardia sp. ICBG1293]|uniref:hypothetical protein n=1 Tax=Pseudonocardia sp. ICBG1293 TaxID=2844382 RepID=UPI001CC9C040|nr:hypothetical protein [Pseudonocardia sp. ICBG1293]